MTHLHKSIFLLELLEELEHELGKALNQLKIFSSTSNPAMPKATKGTKACGPIWCPNFTGMVCDLIHNETDSMCHCHQEAARQIKRASGSMVLI